MVGSLMVHHRSFRLTESRGDSSAGVMSGDGERHSKAIAFAIGQQAIVLVLSALALDGGFLLRVCVIAAVVSWFATALIMLRRPRQPTDVDLVIVKYGFWPAMLTVLVIGIFLNIAAC